MILAQTTFVTQAAMIALGVILVAMLLAFIRLIRGPSLPDRVVALDLIGILSVGFIAAYDMAVEQLVLLDAAIVVALVSFLATIGFAHYVWRRGYDG